MNFFSPLDSLGSFAVDQCVCVCLCVCLCWCIFVYEVGSNVSVKIAHLLHEYIAFVGYTHYGLPNPYLHIIPGGRISYVENFELNGI